MLGNSESPASQARGAVVWGFGHVGRVTAWYLLSRTSLRLTVVERDLDKVKEWLHPLDSSTSSLEEEALRAAVASQRIQVLSSLDHIANPSENALHFVCVNAPTIPVEGQDLTCVIEVLDYLDRVGTTTPIAVRTTTLPGTISSLEDGYFTGSERRRTLISLPCFVRSFEYVRDLFEPDRIVLGCTSRQVALEFARSVGMNELRLFCVAPEEAELSKYADNAFHALKITFANEVAALAERFGASAEVVLGVVRTGTLSSADYYLEPGRPYAGACLPKDLDALVSQLQEESPVIRAIQKSNQLQQQSTVRPNTSLNRSPNGRPAGPGRRYAVHCLRPGLLACRRRPVSSTFALKEASCPRNNLALLFHQSVIQGPKHGSAPTKF